LTLITPRNQEENGMEKRLTRRALLRTLGTGAACAALVGCAPKIVQVTTVVEKQVEKVVKETVVVKEEVQKEVTKVVEKTVVVEKEVVKQAAVPKGTVLFWGHDQHPLDLAATGFVQKYPEIKWDSPHPADRGTKLQAAIAAGSGCPDLYWAEATEAQDYGCNDLLTDLTDVLAPVKDQFHPAKVNETFIAKTGKNIGWPGDISVSAYYYRTDLYAQLGFGEVNWDTLTWTDFLNMVSTVAKKGKYAFVFPADGWSALFEFAMHMVGGTTVSKDGQQITAGSDLGIKAMGMVKQLWDTKAGLNVGWWSAPYWAAIQDGSLIGDFAAAWCRGFIEAQVKTPEQGLGLWKFAKFPTGEGIKYRTGIWGGAQLINPKCSANRDNAILYMQYALGSIEGASLCGTWGIIPAYRPYLASPIFLKAVAALTGQWLVNEFWASQEKELSPDFFRPAGWGAVDAIIGKEMPSILTGELDVQKGMARIVELATPDFERSKCK